MLFIKLNTQKDSIRAKLFTWLCVRIFYHYHYIFSLFICVSGILLHLYSLLWRHKTFNMNPEKPKYYSSTVVCFTLANLLEWKKSPRGQVQGLSFVHFDPFCFSLFWYRCLFPCYGPENWVKSNRLSTYIERLETTLICVENDFLFPFRKSIEPTWVITNLFTIQKKKSWCIDGDILHSPFMVWPFLFSSKYWFSVVNTQLFGIEQDFSGNSWKQIDANWAFRQFVQTFFPISAVSLRIFLTAFWFVIFRHRRSVLWTGFQNCDP